MVLPVTLPLPAPFLLLSLHPPQMATSTAPLLALAPPRFSRQIVCPTPATPSLAPAVKIRSWRRFAASRSEVSLVPAQLPRPPPRRRNALREKASPLPTAPPPLVVRHQVRPPRHAESPELGSLDSDSQELKPGPWGGEPSSDLEERLEISGSLGASRSRNVASVFEFDGEQDVIGVAEDISSCGIGPCPMFNACQDPDGSVVPVEVGNDEIINSSEAADGERGCDSDIVLSRARVMAKELKRGGCGAPKSSSLFQFVAAGRMVSPVLNTGVSVVQRNAAPLGNVAWSGFAALCSVFLVFSLTKLIRRTVRTNCWCNLMIQDTETADGLSSDCFKGSSSELGTDKATLEINAIDPGGVQGGEAPRTSNFAQTAHCEEFAHNTSITGTEACKTSVIAETDTATSFQSREEPVDLMRDTMRPMQEVPTISSGSGKQLNHTKENKHSKRASHIETRTKLETKNTGILENASMPTAYAPQEDTFQNFFAKVPRSEKKKETKTLSNKKPRARLSRNKAQLEEEVCCDKEAETKHSEEAVPGTDTVIDPSNCVQKRKGVTKKRLKKVQNDRQRIGAQDDAQNTRMVDQKNNRKRTRKKNLKNAFHSQGAQSREENLEIPHVVNSPDNAPTNI
ncbi:hypothetical protein ACP4OV_014347 [Aristida adscensionis]